MRAGRDGRKTYFIVNGMVEGIPKLSSANASVVARTVAADSAVLPLELIMAMVVFEICVANCNHLSNFLSRSDSNERTTLMGLI